jgi:hypothetical protein
VLEELDSESSGSIEERLQVSESLIGAVGSLRSSEDSCGLSRFWLSKALSLSSICAISSKALILALSSFSSWDVRGLLSL